MGTQTATGTEIAPTPPASEAASIPAPSTRAIDGNHRSSIRATPPGVLVGLTGADFALLATDSRMLHEHEGAVRIDDSLEKVTVTTSALLAWAGPPELAERALGSGALEPGQGRRVGYSDAAKLAEQLAAAHTAAVIARRRPLATAAMVAGTDSSGRPTIWFLQHAMAFSPIATPATAQAPHPSAAYLIEQYWSPAISRAGALRLAVAVVTATASVNSAAGGPIRAALLDADGPRLIDVDRACSAWAEQSDRMKELFA